MTFDSDELKNDRLMMTERIVRKMRDNEVPYDASLFQNVLYVYTESQQWSDVANLLRSQQSTAHCHPDIKSMKYLRKNLVYCFQNSVRLDVLDAIDSFEQRFFSYQQRRANKQDEPEEQHEDTIQGEDIATTQMSKKLMRREARRSQSRQQAEISENISVEKA